MLKQMYFENKSSEIKEAIVKTYGLLMAYVINEDKYEQVWLCECYKLYSWNNGMFTETF